MLSKQVIHPGWLRVMHWLNVLAVLFMMMSGMRIYNATRFLGFAFPTDITLGGWLGGALLWHFAVMWLLGINACLYLLLNLATGRLFRKFFPLSPRAVWADVRAALTGKLGHADPKIYNMVQRLAYLFVMVDIFLLIVSGLVLWKSVQFPFLSELLFGYEGARFVHFFSMAALFAFIVIHLIMVALVPSTLRTMIRGR